MAGAATAVLLAALLPLATQSAEAASRDRDKKPTSRSCEKQPNKTFQRLLACVSAEGVMKHERAFQAIADANDDQYYPGSRAAGTQGYDDSVDYVVHKLRKAGWKVSLDPVDVEYFVPPILQQLTPVEGDYETGVFTGSGFGSVEGTVIPVDINLVGDRASDSGCTPDDFAGLDFSGPSDIALIQRGTCGFANKSRNAEDAGAEAVIIFNQGNSPDREELIVGNASTLDEGGPSNLTIPVVGASFADGEALAQPGSTAFVEVQEPEIREDFNVIAENPGKNKDNVVMAGAHLDSVEAGPGINDNGSGSAALIELAEQMSKVRNHNTLRFAWWAAEEQGLVGSQDYVDGLPQSELDRIAAYVNFDMIGSPNFIYGVYDADESSFPAPDGVPIPAGSAALEDLFEIYFTWQEIPYEDSEFSGRSDYEAFILDGIPASGLFTGAEVPKTEEQEAIWEGVTGESYDPCYHQACDSLDPVGDGADPAVYAELDAENDLEGNVSLEALGVNSDAIAFTLLSLAYSTEDVNGVPGKDVPKSGKLDLPTEPAGPEGTVGTDGGRQHAHAGPSA
ncbi:M28 family peptidase [Nocardioides sp. GXQ0305]|uniref:M28 family peptidase n=1 Tax=Nocardioides sp. GXQ0305 TaxID=3423912 RepID=UPI003D7D206F